MPETPSERDDARVGRRGFLRLGGAGVLGTLASGVMVSTAGLESAFAQGTAGVTQAPDGTIDVGGGDFGIFNFFFALEQLETAFYSTALQNPYRGMTATERQIIEGIRNNELAHREFFRGVLGPNRIPDLQFDLSSINFRSREAVLTQARNFEELGGTATGNGVGPYIQNPEFLALAGKLISVEARHASTLRELMRPGTTHFAGDDSVDAQGLDLALLPSQLLPLVAPLFATPISANALP